MSNQSVFKIISEERKQQLYALTKGKLNKMFEDKKQTPSLIIPKNLLSFVKTSQYKKFLISIYLYCQQFNQILKKYQELQQKMKFRNNDQTVLLQKQKLLLSNMQKQLSYQYAGILLANASNSGNNTHKDQKQQFFFQTLIYLISKVLKQVFSREQFIPIQEQINRLFRTNRFNIIKRRHQKDHMMKQFPALKEQSNKHKVNLQNIINKAPEQIIAYKRLQKEMKKRNASNNSHNYTTLMGIEQIRDQEQRSPLICTWLPSRKNMLIEFNRPNYANHLKVSSGNRTRIASMTLNNNIHPDDNNRQYY